MQQLFYAYRALKLSVAHRMNNGVTSLCAYGALKLLGTHGVNEFVTNILRLSCAEYVNEMNNGVAYVDTYRVLFKLTTTSSVQQL